MTNAGSARVTLKYLDPMSYYERLRAARVEAWEGKNPGGVRVHLPNPRWERRFLKFLGLSGVEG